MMMLSPAVTQFDRTTLLVPAPVGARSGAASPDAVFTVELDPTWASLRGVHGGYMASLSVRAVQAMDPSRVVRSVSTSFLRPGSVGPATVEVTAIRDGRSLATFDSVLVQDGRTVCVSRVTAATPADGPEWSLPATDVPAPLSDCVPFTPPPSIRHFGQAELLIDPATIPTGDAELARIAGYARPLGDRPIDAAWLVMIGDWFPPAPFRRLMPPAGGVSIDYTVHLHRTPVDAGAPESGWIAGVFSATESSGGIALERGVLSTAGGVAVAETFHTRYTGG